jgi:calcium/calmodulin-dependent 3',5'-cyclic nucleotide phosphodiesterase
MKSRAKKQHSLLGISTQQIDILNTSHGRSSRCFGSGIDEKVNIEDVRVTSFDRVIEILKGIKCLLLNYKAEDGVINELEWVVQKIQSKDLYNFELTTNPSKLENFTKESSDYVIGILNNFSNNKEEYNKIAKENHRKHSNQNLIVKEERNMLKNSTMMMKKEDKEKLSKLLISKPKNPELTTCNTFSYQKAKTLYINETKLDEESISEAFSLGFEEDFEINIESKEFNIFNFKERVDRQRVLPIIYNEVLNSLKLKELHNINNEKLDKFSHLIQDGYIKSVLYHNDLHSTDLCQTLFCWVNNANIKIHLDLSVLDLFALFTAAIIHDFKHPGYTNGFHQNNLTELALIYNDKSVLENMHISEAFKILMRTDCNFIENFSVIEFKEIRKRMIECVLATDMIHHARIMSQLKAKASVLEINNGHNIEKLFNPESKTFFEDKQEMLNLLIHLGDLSHNTKSFEISKTWTYLLYEEFYKQGDHEKSLNVPISMFCDRSNSNIPKAQIGFIKGIVIPSFDLLVNFFPQLNYTIQNLEDNIECWNNLLEENK